VKRRTFIAGVGSTAAWPFAARAQQGDRVRRIGVLMNAAADDPYLPAALAAFEQGLQALSWTAGRNIQIDYRFGAFGRGTL
jgi:putative ABC transport system substrate-binding protein